MDNGRIMKELKELMEAQKNVKLSIIKFELVNRASSLS